MWFEKSSSVQIGNESRLLQIKLILSLKWVSLSLWSWIPIFQFLFIYLEGNSIQFLDWVFKGIPSAPLNVKICGWFIWKVGCCIWLSIDKHCPMKWNSQQSSLNLSFAGRVVNLRLTISPETPSIWRTGWHRVPCGDFSQLFCLPFNLRIISNLFNFSFWWNPNASPRIFRNCCDIKSFFWCLCHCLPHF